VSISGQWIDEMMGQLDHVFRGLTRIHFKSLGGILARQEWIAQEFAKKWLVVERVDVTESA